MNAMPDLKKDDGISPRQQITGRVVDAKLIRTHFGQYVQARPANQEKSIEPSMVRTVGALVIRADLERGKMLVWIVSTMRTMVIDKFVKCALTDEVITTINNESKRQLESFSNIDIFSNKAIAWNNNENDIDDQPLVGEDVIAEEVIPGIEDAVVRDIDQVEGVISEQEQHLSSNLPVVQVDQLATTQQVDQQDDGVIGQSFPDDISANNSPPVNNIVRNHSYELR